MEKNKGSYYLLLALISGIVFWLSWPPKHTSVLIFIALVPLIFIENQLFKLKTPKSTWKLFIYVFSGFLVWNILSTYWIYLASLPGAISAILINALFMTLPFVVFHRVKKWSNRNLSSAYLVAFWLTFELIHLNWDFAWPWLTLGNVFASYPNWVQWYEITGTLGGTLWIWVINILVFKLTDRIINPTNAAISKINIGLKSLVLLAGILIPILISILMKPELPVASNKNVVIVQPNIDPYNEKFVSGTFEKQILSLIRLSDSLIDENTALVIWPETSISRPQDEDAINRLYYFRVIRSLLHKHPHVKLIAGADTYRFYKEGEEMSPTARFYKFDSTYYESFNTAILLDSSQVFDIYHKARLVPGVEQMPYPKVFKFLSRLVIDLGGTSGSLCKSDEAKVFTINDELIAAPIICYESVFGDYCGDYVMKGANLLTIITNDGWWGNTGGHKQHYMYAALRAIELRKDVARSANTGISCYINSNGEILNRTNWWEQTSIKQDITLNNKVTFYARSGDYIGRIASFVSIIIILVSIIKRLMNKNVFEKNE